MSRAKRAIAYVVTTSLLYSGLLSGVQATMISTEQLADAQATAESAEAGQGRALLVATLDRVDVQAALQARGVDVEQARARVAALTDAEATAVAAQIDQAPAGGDVLGTIVFVFLVLLVTDILGFTKVFPFTRSIRH
ncbi:PA2779 family protein [Aquabacterium sp.]|uniref:PA2779 family protein n=1 Tax=Aquabacterium sp. TaxID=1872578 RepID=UPI0035B40CED